MFRGSYVAIVTPFKNGKVDEKAFRKLIEFQIAEGTNGLVVCGCTGEPATLTMEEHEKLMKIAVETVAGRIPVIGGTGSNCTKEAIELTSFAKKAGCNGVLLITPYYNKPTPEGQYRHYKAIAEKVDIPIILYNVPSRTGISLSPSIVKRLFEIKNIAAIKEASGSVQQVMDIKAISNIVIMSGDDSLTLPFMSLGATGVVSVAANIVPRKVKTLVQSYLNGRHEESRKIHYELLELFQAMFFETNPIPVKTALSMMGMVEEEWRLPLCEMTRENKERLRKVLKKYKLI